MSLLQIYIQLLPVQTAWPWHTVFSGMGYQTMCTTSLVPWHWEQITSLFLLWFKILLIERYDGDSIHLYSRMYHVQGRWVFCEHYIDGKLFNRYWKMCLLYKKLSSCFFLWHCLASDSLLKLSITSSLSPFFILKSPESLL